MAFAYRFLPGQKDKVITAAACPHIRFLGPQDTTRKEGTLHLVNTLFSERMEGITVEVSWSDLIQFCLLIVSIVGLVWSMTKKK